MELVVMAWTEVELGDGRDIEASKKARRSATFKTG